MTALFGYRDLTKWDFNMSRFGGFGLRRQQQILLTRRPVQRLFFLGFAPEKFLDLEVVTSGSNSERGVVLASVRCFTLLGTELLLPPDMAQQKFFADTLNEASPQRLWVRRPKRGVFALVSLMRTTKGKHVGVKGRLALGRAKTERGQTVDVLASRDRLALEAALDFARVSADRDEGRRILARLIYLWQFDHHRRELAILEDVEKLISSPIKLPDIRQETLLSNKTYIYSLPISGEMNKNVSPSKWLLHEASVLARCMVQNRQGLIMIKGQNRSLSMLITAQLAAEATGSKVDANVNNFETDISWLTDVEAKGLILSVG